MEPLNVITTALKQIDKEYEEKSDKIVVLTNQVRDLEIKRRSEERRVGKECRL